MMKFKKVQDVEDEKFQRLTGVERSTFDQRHPLKTQLVMSKSIKKMICTFFPKGRRHDFRICKESKITFHREIYLLTDGGYRGLKKLHAKTQMPKRRSKKNNPFISKERVMNENTISLLKRCKILADRYRNRRKRFGLRFNLIAGVMLIGFE